MMEKIMSTKGTKMHEKEAAEALLFPGFFRVLSCFSWTKP